MIISNSKQYIFVHIHKCAGTSVTKALAEHLTWNDLQLGTTEIGDALNDPYEKQFGLCKHSTGRAIRQVVGNALWDAYFTFAVVRNPFSRLLSLYTFVRKQVEAERRYDGIRKLLRRTPRACLAWPLSQAYLRTSSFSDFIRRAAGPQGGWRQGPVRLDL